MFLRVIYNSFFSILQRRPRIFKEVFFCLVEQRYLMTFFMLGRIMKIFISSFLQRRPMIFKESFLLGRIVRIFISSNLQRRPKIFKEFFMLGRIIKIFISSILQRRPSIFKEIVCLEKHKDIFFLEICQAIWVISYSLLYSLIQKNGYTFSAVFCSKCVTVFLNQNIVSKINQGSCLGCLGGDDAPE